MWHLIREKKSKGDHEDLLSPVRRLASLAVPDRLPMISWPETDPARDSTGSPSPGIDLVKKTVEIGKDNSRGGIKNNKANKKGESCSQPERTQKQTPKVSCVKIHTSPSSRCGS